MDNTTPPKELTSRLLKHKPGTLLPDKPKPAKKSRCRNYARKK